ncbi:MAG: glycosyl hydrolase family 98 C-terminal domain-containing protein, partial [Eubacteriales bacterium]
IDLVVKYGAYFIWSDTNISYDSGMIMQWLESNEAFYSAFKNNSENIVLMNKESYGDPSTSSVMQGLWLSGLVGNWGVSSDWWHWQVDGDKKSLFGEFDQYVDDEWDMILSYPENMYVQSMMLVMSCGGTCFAAEAPNFSTSSGGIPIAGFQYGISPLLNSIISGETAIPTKPEVLKDTSAAVLGKKNYPEFNYNYKESNLYPNTGRFRMIPLLPANLRLAERAVFEENGIALIEKKENQTYFDKIFKQEAAGNTYAMRIADEWFFINNVENARATKSVAMTPVLCSANSLTITAQEHTSAIITEKNDKLSFYLSNYRTDKTNMIKTVTPAYRTGKNWIDICKEFMIIDKNGDPVGLDDSIKRTTIITVNGTLNGGEPEIVWVSKPDGSGYQNRPFSYTSAWNQAENKLILTIHHNGVVKFDVLLDKKDNTVEPLTRTPIAATLKSNKNPTNGLQAYLKTLTVTDKSNYNEYSFLQFNAALEKAKVIITEGTYSLFDIYAAEVKLKNAYSNLLDISKYITLLKKAKAVDTAGWPQLYKTQLSLAIDTMLRESLSNDVYVAGRSNKLEYNSSYKNRPFNKVIKTMALEEKYKDLLEKIRLFEN